MTGNFIDAEILDLLNTQDRDLVRRSDMFAVSDRRDLCPDGKVQPMYALQDNTGAGIYIPSLAVG
jgi:hypothetical protein